MSGKQIQLESSLVEALLSGPSSRGGSLWERLEKARKKLKRIVHEAEQAVQDSPLVNIVLDETAQKHGLKNAHLQIRSDGTVWLAESRLLVSDRPPKSKKKRRRYQIKARALALLRREAEELGVDISHLGRDKKRIEAALDKAKTGLSPEEVTPKPVVKPSPKIVPPDPKAKPEPEPLVVGGTGEPDLLDLVNDNMSDSDFEIPDRDEEDDEECEERYLIRRAQKKKRFKTTNGMMGALLREAEDYDVEAEFSSEEFGEDTLDRILSG